MRRCRVWAAIRSTVMPARAALVAWPARSEWPLIRSLGEARSGCAFLDDVGDGVAGDGLE
jgi:hypothetical protein